MQWFYSCNGKQYASKFQAIKENINTGHPVHFNANETWNGYDFSAEPEETWPTLLKQEAIKLRESYSYIKLWYSGGADSDLVLTTFVQNGIYVDEICCSKSGLGSADYEIDNFAFQYLKQIEPIIPKTKITILEPNIKTTFFGFGYRYNIGKSKLLLSLKGYYLSLGKFSAPWAGLSIGKSF